MFYKLFIFSFNITPEIKKKNVKCLLVIDYQKLLYYKIGRTIFCYKYLDILFIEVSLFCKNAARSGCGICVMQTRLLLQLWTRPKFGRYFYKFHEIRYIVSCRTHYPVCTTLQSLDTKDPSGVILKERYGDNKIDNSYPSILPRTVCL